MMFIISQKQNNRKNNKMKNVHVVPCNGKWAVKKERVTKVSFMTSTKREAEKLGRELARKEKSTMIMHSKDGRFCSKR